MQRVWKRLVRARGKNYYYNYFILYRKGNRGVPTSQLSSRVSNYSMGIYNPCVYPTEFGELTRK